MVAAGYGAADRLLRTGDTATGTITLAGTPPLALPAGVSGHILVSDSSGNLTLQSPVSGAPTGSASGDLSGTYPGPAVSGITGVAVSGTPTAGNTLVVQSGGTTAHWQAPAGAAPTGAASGDLSGSYPGPAVAGIASIPITASPSPVAGNTLVVQSGGTSLSWTTPAAGVTLDSTAGDLQPDAVTAVAGSVGKAADSGHQHPGSNVIGGVTVGGTPALGKTIIASTSSAAAWTTPAVTLDTTASDIAVLAASAVAGSVGKAADSGHQHPYTGLALLSGAAFTGAVSTTSRLTSGVVGLTDASTIAVNAALGNTFRVTINGNRTLGTPSSPADGQMIIFEITQGSGAPYTLGYTGVYIAGATVAFPTLSTSAGVIDTLGFKYNATNNVWRLMAVALGFAS